MFGSLVSLFNAISPYLQAAGQVGKMGIDAYSAYNQNQQAKSEDQMMKEFLAQYNAPEKMAAQAGDVAQNQAMNPQDFYTQQNNLNQDQSGGGSAPGGGTTGVIGSRAGGTGGGDALTPQSAKEGLNVLKTEGQAAGLTNASEDYYLDLFARQKNMDPNVLRQLLESLGEV